MTLTHAQTEELACTYAALILHDAKATISADNILALTKAANVKVAAYWPKVFAQAFEKRNVGDYLAAGPGTAPAPSTTTTAAPVAGKKEEAKKEEPKKEEKKEESDEDMGFGLFD
eukprot:TRINITY_DN2967_c0_g1_i2.p1 TRINITY_DN2967_c0_g1~~TRINITY_DN2967_c0_g1_i2.p1  ORF type:complete len:115 (-),score=39.72 TRINITY_DN2967_c0_g1_i2:146-490(-)